MASKRMEFLIGMMVVTVFVTIVFMTVLFVPQKKLFNAGGGKKMTILFDKAAGITNNSRVMKSGIEIGRVFKSELNEQPEKSEVRVTFKLNPDAKIFSNEYARINRTILGDAAIEFVKNPNYKGDIFELKSSDSIAGVPGGDLTATVSNIEGDLAKAIQSVNTAAKELTTFMGNLNHFMGTPEELDRKKGRLETIFKELNDTLITTRNLAANMNSIVADKKVQNNIRMAASNIPDILGKVDALLGNANILADDFRQTMSKTHDTFDMVGKNLDNLHNFTAALAEDGPEFISSLNESSSDMRQMIGNISLLAEDLVNQMDNPETPLGMLSDPEVGESIRAVVKNAEVITEKVHPILDDTRVFTNKIAHKPSSLVWPGKTYKGSPTLSSTQYNFQSYSPGGGLTSPLFTASVQNSSPTLPLTNSDGALRPDAIDPDTIEAYYARNPDALANAAGLSKMRFSGSCPLSRNKEIVYDSESTLDDPMAYYGFSDAQDTGSASAPSAGRGGKLCFSLGSVFGKIFHRSPQTEPVADESAPMTWDASYLPENQFSDDSSEPQPEVFSEDMLEQPLPAPLPTSENRPTIQNLPAPETNSSAGHTVMKRSPDSFIDDGLPILVSPTSP